MTVWYKPPRPQNADQTKPPWALLQTSIGPVFSEFWVSRRALIIPALAYVGGLVVWSINASRNHLGSQIDASAQYLVAGIVPAILILLGFALVVSWVRTPAWARNKLRTERPNWIPYLWVSAAIAVAVWFGAVVFDLLAAVGVSAPTASSLLPGRLGLVLATLSAVLSAMILACVWERASNYGLIYGLIGIVAGIAAAAVLYMNQVYPQLPQSLGGGQTRCAVLDIQTALVSPETLEALVPQGKSNTETARTKQVDVLFSTGDTLFVRPQIPSAAQTLELRGDVLRAIIGCG